MGIGEVVYISSRLLLGALAAFFGIILWSRTRDSAWMLIVAGTFAAYGDTIYSILKLLGIAGENVPSNGSLSLLTIVLSCLPTVFFIAAFVLKVTRKYRFDLGHSQNQ